MPKIVDLSDKKYAGDFGRLTVLFRHPGVYPSMYRCRCECGHETDVAHGNLRSGRTRSCSSWCPAKFLGRTVGAHRVLSLHDFPKALYVVECVSCGRRSVKRASTIPKDAKACGHCSKGRLGMRTAKPVIKVEDKMLTRRQCAEAMGVTRQRVSQLEASGKLAARAEAALFEKGVFA